MDAHTFTHGNALQIQTPDSFQEIRRLGWGTEIRLKWPEGEFSPAHQTVLHDILGPGSWCHLPLAAAYGQPDRHRWTLRSVSLLFRTQNCRIANLHVYDGSYRVAAFDTDDLEFGLTSSDLDRPHTVQVRHHPGVRWALGISFYAYTTNRDRTLNPDRAHDPVLTVAGGGATLRRPNALVLPFLDLLRGRVAVARP